MASSYPPITAPFFSTIPRGPGPTPGVLSARAARVSALSRCSPDGYLGHRTIPLLWGPPSALTPDPALPTPRSACSPLRAQAAQPFLLTCPPPSCSLCFAAPPAPRCNLSEKAGRGRGASARTRRGLRPDASFSQPPRHRLEPRGRAAPFFSFLLFSSLPSLFPSLPSPTPVLLRPSLPIPPTPYVFRDPAFPPPATTAGSAQTAWAGKNPGPRNPEPREALRGQEPSDPQSRPSANPSVLTAAKT